MILLGVLGMRTDTPPLFLTRGVGNITSSNRRLDRAVCFSHKRAKYFWRRGAGWSEGRV